MLVGKFRETLDFLESCIAALETHIPKPRIVTVNGNPQWRYRDPTPAIAAVQKLACVISGLDACLVLIASGFVQEVGAIQRMLDEFAEDVMFLCIPASDDQVADLQNRYLAAFCAEEFTTDALRSPQRRDMVPRRNIQAANARFTETVYNRSDAQEMHRTVHRANSGFIHGASPHIMEMYGGSPPRFHVRGMLGTPRVRELEESLIHYFHRGINAACAVALAVGDRRLADQIQTFRIGFEEDTGYDLSQVT